MGSIFDFKVILTVKNGFGARFRGLSENLAKIAQIFIHIYSEILKNCFKDPLESPFRTSNRLFDLQNRFNGQK